MRLFEQPLALEPDAVIRPCDLLISARTEDTMQKMQALVERLLSEIEILNSQQWLGNSKAKAAKKYLSLCQAYIKASQAKLETTILRKNLPQVVVRLMGCHNKFCKKFNSRKYGKRWNIFCRIRNESSSIDSEIHALSAQFGQVIRELSACIKRTTPLQLASLEAQGAEQPRPENASAAQASSLVPRLVPDALKVNLFQENLARFLRGEPVFSLPHFIHVNQLP